MVEPLPESDVELFDDLIDSANLLNDIDPAVNTNKKHDNENDNSSSPDALEQLCQDPMSRPVKLVDEGFHFTSTDHHQDDMFLKNAGFLVVGVIGDQPILSNALTYYHATRRAEAPTNTNFGHSTGIESVEQSIDGDSALTASKGPGDWALGVWAEMTSLQLIAFLLNVCHVVVTVSDNLATSPSRLHRLIDRASQLRPRHLTQSALALLDLPPSGWIAEDLEVTNQFSGDGTAPVLYPLHDRMQKPPGSLTDDLVKTGMTTDLYTASLIHVFNKAPSSSYLDPSTYSRIDAFHRHLLPLLYPELRRLHSHASIGPLLLTNAVASSHTRPPPPIEQRLPDMDEGDNIGHSLLVEQQQEDIDPDDVQLAPGASNDFLGGFVVAGSETELDNKLEACDDETVVRPDAEFITESVGGGGGGDYDAQQQSMLLLQSAPSKDDDQVDEVISPTKSQSPVGTCCDDAGVDSTEAATAAEFDLPPGQSEGETKEKMSAIDELMEPFQHSLKITTGDSDNLSYQTGKQQLIDTGSTPTTTSTVDSNDPQPHSPVDSQPPSSSTTDSTVNRPSRADLASHGVKAIEQIETALTCHVKRLRDKVTTDSAFNGHPSPLVHRQHHLTTPNDLASNQLTKDVNDLEDQLTDDNEEFDAELRQAKLRELEREVYNARLNHLHPQRRLDLPRFFMLPEVDCEGHTPSGCPSYQTLARVLQEAILSTPRQHMLPEMTEKEWLTFAQEQWRLVAESPLLPFLSMTSKSTDDSPTSSFETFELNPELLQACARLEWVKPTAIQALAIPHALKGRSRFSLTLFFPGESLVALAETGSGKTAAYALPIVQKLLESPHHYFALILAPTRELAAQVQAQFVAIGKVIGLSSILLVGGVPITQQADQMRATPPHVLIATPGRLVDHLRKTKGFDDFKLASLKFLVIDEADRMLGSDFDSVLDKVLAVLPSKRQTFLFSATMTDKVGKLQRASVRNPVHLSTRRSKFEAVANLRQFIHLVPQDQIDAYIVHLLQVAFSPSKPGPGLDAIRLVVDNDHHRQEGHRSDSVMPTSAIIFTRTKVESNRLAFILKHYLTQPVIAFNGDIPQAQRIGALNKFKRTPNAVLVATDVASRGLDIPQVGLVINYDVPLEAKTYMHRVGRTARAGRVGCALTLLTQYSVVFFLKEIEARLVAGIGNSAKVPNLLQPNSPEDKALEASVAELELSIKEAAAHASQAVEAMRKRGGGGSRSSAPVPSLAPLHSATTASSASAGITTESKPTLQVKRPGLKPFGWASQAPEAKKAEIATIMSAMTQGASAGNDDDPGSYKIGGGRQSKLKRRRKEASELRKAARGASRKPPPSSGKKTKKRK